VANVLEPGPACGNDLPIWGRKSKGAPPNGLPAGTLTLFRISEGNRLQNILV
jgi:hypothetical protein